jgi:hypothetical protein
VRRHDLENISKHVPERSAERGSNSRRGVLREVLMTLLLPYTFGER